MTQEQLILTQETQREEANYKVAKKLHSDLSNGESVKEFNIALQNKVNDKTLGRGQRLKK